eukprot:9309890-Heterocapsa_arctica.AAC.1
MVPVVQETALGVVGRYRRGPDERGPWVRLVELFRSPAAFETSQAAARSAGRPSAQSRAKMSLRLREPLR